MFFFVEDAPLLYILEDFLPQLDEFFLKQESNLDVKEIDHALYSDESDLEIEEDFYQYQVCTYIMQLPLLLALKLRNCRNCNTRF